MGKKYLVHDTMEVYLKEHYISMEGIIETDLSHKEFLDKFIVWVENNGYRFCGSSREVDEEGNPLECELPPTEVTSVLGSNIKRVL
jgi:hypothetical protein